MTKCWDIKLTVLMGSVGVCRILFVFVKHMISVLSFLESDMLPNLFKKVEYQMVTMAVETGIEFDKLLYPIHICTKVVDFRFSYL